MTRLNADKPLYLGTLGASVPVGGDTIYASMERAWELLSEPLKRFLAPLRAVHSARSAYDPKTTGEGKYNGETFRPMPVPNRLLQGMAAALSQLTICSAGRRVATSNSATNT